MTHDHSRQLQELRAKVSVLSQIIAKAHLYADTDPEIALHQARKSAEAICLSIFSVVIGPPGRLQFEDLIRKLDERKVLPRRVLIPLRTIQAYGNHGSHPDLDGGTFDPDYAAPCLLALAQVTSWYFIEYLGIDLPPELATQLSSSGPLMAAATHEPTVPELAITDPHRDPTHNKGQRPPGAHTPTEEDRNIVAQAKSKVGPRGPIVVEESYSMVTSLNLYWGLQFDMGFLSPEFVTDEERMEVVIDSPYILICDFKLDSATTIPPFLSQVARLGRPLLIIAEFVDENVLELLVAQHARREPPLAAVEAPGFGATRSAMLQDIAVLTAGRVLIGDPRTALRDVQACLGRASKVRIERTATTIIDGKGAPEAIISRIEQLREELAITTSDYDREKLSARIEKLDAGVAVIKVGAESAVARRIKKARLEAALRPPSP